MCRNWKTQYETWTIHGNLECVLEAYIPIDAKEILIQLKQSLRRSQFHDHCNWNLQFPLCISSSARSFTVLRTLHRIKEESPVTLRSAPLPLSFGTQKECDWSPRVPLEWKSGGYLHNVLFSDDDEYLCFYDYPDDESSDAAILKIHKAQLSLISLVSYIKIKSHRFYSPVFMRGAPVLAFISGCRSVNIWPFFKGKSEALQSPPLALVVSISYSLHMSLNL